MKKINNLLLFMAIALLFASSCGKDGAAGPAGATGPTGAQGPVGPAGPAGANGQPGSVIYSGITNPPGTTGVTGDFYLDIATGLLYGPKTATGWGMGFSLIGPAGAAGATGASGNTILSGMGIPSATLGNTGDYYLDRASYLLYGPRTNTGWGQAVSLRGPVGTANVIYSGWNSLTNGRDTLVYGYYTALADLAAPALTQSTLDDGIFQVYIRNINWENQTSPLPYAVFVPGITYTTSYITELGHFIITYSASDNSHGYNITDLSVDQYRYVIIPGGIKDAALKQVNLKDYEAVRKFFRLPD